MKRILAWWHRMQVEYYRRQAAHAALALLLSPDAEAHGVREYFRYVTKKIDTLTRSGA